tara:strand:+ start:6414 stop:6932 length:519 start_codon:yes stop_codon:yes gene_type:complete
MFGLINYGDEFLGNNPFQIGDLGFAPGAPGQGSGSLYVNPFRKGDRSAQDTLADLYEAEFQDYLNRFFPVEEDLINQMTTGFGELQQEEIGRAQVAVARQFANTRGQEIRRQQGFGITRRPQNEMDFQRAETSSLVAARNFARMRSEDRRSQILSGGLGSGLQGRSLGDSYG